jgi:hypothetical protein
MRCLNSPCLMSRIPTSGATYVEPVARVEAGDLTAEKIWGDMLRDMPKGLPQKGDRGLDYCRPGGGPIGVAQCSACLPMPRFAKHPATRRDSSRRCAASSMPAGTMSRIGARGRSVASSASVTRPLARPCSATLQHDARQALRPRPRRAVARARGLGAKRQASVRRQRASRRDQARDHGSAELAGSPEPEIHRLREDR